MHFSRRVGTLFLLYCLACVIGAAQETASEQDWQAIIHVAFAEIVYFLPGETG
jgi:hypothetical protein